MRKQRGEIVRVLSLEILLLLSILLGTVVLVGAIAALVGGVVGGDIEGHKHYTVCKEAIVCDSGYNAVPVCRTRTVCETRY